MKLERTWPWVVVALYCAALVGSCWAAALSELPPNPLEALWWSIAVPGVFYLAPAIHVAGRMEAADASSLRAFLEPIVPAAAVASVLAVAFHWTVGAPDVLPCGDDRSAPLFLNCYHPGIVFGWHVVDSMGAGGKGVVFVLMLVLDSILAEAICLGRGLRSGPWSGAVFSCRACLGTIPMVNLALLLPCFAIGPAMSPLLEAFYGLHPGVVVWCFVMVVGERVILPAMLLCRSMTRQPTRPLEMRPAGAIRRLVLGVCLPFFLFLVLWMLTPQQGRVRACLPTTECIVNLKGLALGIQFHAEDNAGDLPPDFLPSSPDRCKGCGRKYVHVLRGRRKNLRDFAVPEDQLLAYCPAPHDMALWGWPRESRYIRAVVFLDGHVELVRERDFPTALIARSQRASEAASRDLRRTP